MTAANTLCVFYLHTWLSFWLRYYSVSHFSVTLTPQSYGAAARTCPKIHAANRSKSLWRGNERRLFCIRGGVCGVPERWGCSWGQRGALSITGRHTAERNRELLPCCGDLRPWRGKFQTGWHQVFVSFIALVFLNPSRACNVRIKAGMVLSVRFLREQWSHGLCWKSTWVWGQHRLSCLF